MYHPLSCSQCGELVYDYEQLVLHYMEQHVVAANGGGRPLECPWCHAVPDSVTSHVPRCAPFVKWTMMW